MLFYTNSVHFFQNEVRTGNITSFPLHFVVLIIIGVVALLPWVYGLILPIVKPKISKTGLIFLYTFSSGFFLILGIFGFLSEAREQLNIYLENLIAQEIINSPSEWLISISIIGFGLLFFLILALGGKFIFGRFVIRKDRKMNMLEKRECSQEHVLNFSHNHDELIFNSQDINPKLKLYSLFLIAPHKVVGGLLMGILASQISHAQSFNPSQILFLVTFVLHIIPEELVYYYRQIDAGIRPWRAALNSFLLTMILIPFIFIGAYTSEAIASTEWYPIFMVVINIAIASLFIFTSLVELIPEFLHSKLDSKTYYKSLLMLILGIGISAAIYSVHTHGGDLESGHIHNLNHLFLL